MNLNENLIKDKIIDHNIIHHEFPSFHCFSLNIAQISHIRTMTIFNKINRYLKTSADKMNYLPKEEMYYLFENMYKIILKYNFHNTEVIEGSKILIVDSNIIDDVKQLVAPHEIQFLYLRKYFPKTNKQIDQLFRQRFEKCGFRYFDIVFQEETIEKYKTRLEKIFLYFKEVSVDKKCIFLFQEINPILDFLDVLQSYKDVFDLIDPNFKKNSSEKIPEKIFSKSVNVILTTKGFKHRIKKCESDEIINFFAYEGHEKQKNQYQNVRYYLPKFKLYLYNIHSYLYSNKKLLEIMENDLLQYIQKYDNIAIVGDFNFKLNSENLENFKILLEKFNLTYTLLPLPYSSKMYEGVITSLPKKIETKVSDVSS